MAEAPSEELCDEEQDEEEEPEDSSFQEYMNAFSAKDAVLEPSIIKTFERYVDLGGSADHGIRALCKSYVGLPHMINLMMEWLRLAGYKRYELQNIVEDHLKLLIVRNFDPKKADLIFTEEGSSQMPPWLEDMIGFPSWRDLFHQLAEQYPDCLMLKFTIKLIADAGYQGHPSSSTSTITHLPDSFATLVRKTLKQIAKCSSSALHEKLAELTQSVCHSQHTYFYLQAMLQSLSQGHGTVENFRVWLSQEMQNEVRKRKHDVTSITLHLNGMGSHDKLFEALTAMLSRGALNPADITILYRQFANDSGLEESKRPAATNLHIPRLLELLVQALFKPSSAINPDHKEKYLYILAYAVSVYDQEEGPNREELEATKKAIETAHMICSRASDSHAELQVEVPTLFDCIRYPAVSMGVLLWVEHTLTDTTFFEVAAESSPLYLALLDEVARCHKLQHPFVLAILKKLIERSYPMLEVNVQLELKKSLVDHLVQLFSCGHVLPVVDYIEKCFKMETLDHSLVRHFVSEVLNIIEPPYSRDFVSYFLPLVQDQNVGGTLQTADSSDVVSAFLGECSKKSKKKRDKK